MFYTRRASVFAHAAFAVLLLVCASCAVETARARTSHPNRQAMTALNAPDIAFTVSMPQPHTHLLEVEMRVRSAAPNSASPAPTHAELRMPVWTPGSYLVREYARHVQDFAARDSAGRELPWRKTDKNTWRVETGGAREWRANYRVYANEATPRTSEVNDRHAFWNNAALLMYLEGHLTAPATLRVRAPQGWKVATGLPAVAGEPNAFRADNFDHLYDSPFEVGTFKTIEFEVRGVPHRLVIDGEGNYDAERLRRDMARVCEAQAALMGGLPFKDYTFILHLGVTGGGATEHLNSVAMTWARFNFRPEAQYQNFLGLVSHEYFHAWNVKRIRPDALGPFDYSGENYTTLLWVAEGMTDYYGSLLLRRAGLTTEKDYLDALARSFQTLQNTPGRARMSVEEASFDAWIKHYRRDENYQNTQISYYDKGAILSALLDLHIRRLSGYTRSLDDVMRRLYAEFYLKNRNYTPEDFQRAAEWAAGASLEDFFRRYVRGREELNYDAAFSAVGLRLDTNAPASGDATRPPAVRAFLGATMARADEIVTLTTAPASGIFRTTLSPDALVVKYVNEGTPAYDFGLNAGDQVVALDGVRVTRETFDRRLEEKRPGDMLAVTIFRGDELRTLNVKLAGRSDGVYRLVPLKERTPEQLRAYQQWLGLPRATRDE
jgi:predicted metalloprotease with PDZ domain